MGNNSAILDQTGTESISKTAVSLSRPYLVIPKLIEQPTWGGQHIVRAKGWDKIEGLGTIKIGQSYELFSGSNLSLLDSSEDPQFSGELTDNQQVETLTQPASSIGLRDLLAQSGADTLGKDVIAERGPEFALLVKYTQALGNSFQTHIRDGITDPVWKPKPESWYYFEPGSITLGAKPGIDWQDYQTTVETLQAYIATVGEQVQAGSLSYDEAKEEIAKAIKTYDPYKFVNKVNVEKDQLVDLSSGGLHHSWEEDLNRSPLGNVLLELQSEAMDNISTFRSFDKGKMSEDGSIRQLQIKEYFEAIDRSPEVNDPNSHMRHAQQIAKTAEYSLGRLLETRHYNLDKLILLNPSGTYAEKITRYKHLFVKHGRIEVTSDGQSVTVSTAHSCFVPAGAHEYTIKNLAPRSEVLISY